MNRRAREALEQIRIGVESALKTRALSFSKKIKKNSTFYLYVGVAVFGCRACRGAPNAEQNEKSRTENGAE